MQPVLKTLRRAVAAVCACVFLVGSLAMASRAEANTQYVHRCVGPSGEPSFSDHACGDAGTALQSAPRQRVASIRQVTLPAGFSDCARSPQELQQRTDAALVTHDAVRLSGLILWQVASPRAARQSLLSLSRLTRAPADMVVEAPGYDDGSGVDMATLVSLRPAAVADSDAPVYEFRYTIAQRRGCYWLKPTED